MCDSCSFFIAIGVIPSVLMCTISYSLYKMTKERDKAWDRFLALSDVMLMGINGAGSYNVDPKTAIRNEDGSVTVTFKMERA